MKVSFEGPSPVHEAETLVAGCLAVLVDGHSAVDFNLGLAPDVTLLSSFLFSAWSDWKFLIWLEDKIS